MRQHFHNLNGIHLTIRISQDSEEMIFKLVDVTLHRTDSFGDVIFKRTGVKNLFTADSSCSSFSVEPNRKRTLSSNSVIQI